MEVLICFGFSNNLKTTFSIQIIQLILENNSFSVISLGLITIRGRGLPITSHEIRHALLLSIVLLLPHVHMFRLYFTAFSTSETCKLLLPQHTKFSRQCFALKSAKSVEFIFT